MKRTGKRWLALLLCAALPAAGLPLSAAAAGSYEDVPEGAWYAPAVKYVSENGWMNEKGGGCFVPAGSVRRLDFVEALYHMAGMPETVSWGSGSGGFTDLDDERWVPDAAVWAYQNSVADGTAEGKFSQDELVTREQMAQFLYRYARAAGNDVSFPETAGERFPDFDRSSQYSRDALRWAADRGILQGDQHGNLRPKDGTTRAEMAMILWQAGPVLVKRTLNRSARPSKMGLKWGLTPDVEYPRVDGSTSTLGLAREAFRSLHDLWASDYERYPQQASKTVPSYHKLIDGEADVILAPYASQEVLEEARQKGVELEFHKVAEEALVFITPKENSAENITEEQALSIYRDYAIRNWKTLGGPDRELVPLCRNADSGSQSQMENLILKGDPMHPDIEKNYIVLAMLDMLRETLNYHTGGEGGKPTNSYALGYSLFTYVDMAVIDNATVAGRLKMLSYNGVAPTKASLKDGSYPLTDGYYAVVRGDTPADVPARKLIAYLQSGDAAEGMEQAGYLSVS